MTEAVGQESTTRERNSRFGRNPRATGSVGHDRLSERRWKRRATAAVTLLALASIFAAKSLWWIPLAYTHPRNARTVKDEGFHSLCPAYLPRYYPIDTYSTPFVVRHKRWGWVPGPERVDSRGRPIENPLHWTWIPCDRKNCPLDDVRE